MGVTLTSEQQRVVKAQVERGGYSSEEEVIHEALRLLQERDEADFRCLEEFRGEIAIGMEQLRRGEKLSGSDVYEELKQRSRERRQSIP